MLAALVVAVDCVIIKMKLLCVTGCCRAAVLAAAVCAVVITEKQKGQKN